MNKKRNIVFIAQSLDGYIAGPEGELDWLDMVPNPDKDDMGYFALMDEVDAIVMGRKSFDFVAGYDGPWPYKKKVFVLSNTLKEIPEPLRDKCALIKGEVKDILRKLTDLGYPRLYIDGGVTVQNFLKEDLIDELRITTLPILLGGGVPLFGKMEKQLAFEHKQTKVYLGELVQSQYVRNRSK